ncbi:hypothetical protein EMIT0111MI5_11336 [Burkholderia sp. IT-111MI5]
MPRGTPFLVVRVWCVCVGDHFGRRVCIALYLRPFRKKWHAESTGFGNMPDTWAGSTVDMQEAFDARRLHRMPSDRHPNFRQGEHS